MPAASDIFLQRGVAHHQAGRLVEAGRHYAQARAHAPRSFDALHLSGLLAYQEKHYKQARLYLEQARSINPRSALCLQRLGLACAGEGEPAKGVAWIREALKLDPKISGGWLTLALALRDAGELDEAVAAAEKAALAEPKSLVVLENCGALVSARRGMAAALPYFERATKIAPDSANAWAQRGVAAAQSGGAEGALDFFSRALTLDPHHVLARHGRAFARQSLHEIAGALADYTAVLEQNPQLHEARSAYLLCQQYSDAFTAAELAAAREKFGRQLPAPAPREFLRPKDANRKLRVAFLSPDLRAHSVAFFLEPLLENFDRTAWEIFLYHDHSKCDGTSERLKNLADSWTHLAGMKDAAVEAIFARDRPDIVIDLAGHTGHNRQPLLARRLAPLQLSYLGYPDATGIAASDGRISDSVADPESAGCGEKIWRMAGTAWCYRPPQGAPAVATLPGVARGFTTFGSCNNFSKVSPATLALWAEILRGEPGARLLLKSDGIEQPARQEKIWKEFESRGISDARLRVEIHGRTRDVASHLEFYARIDVTLDTFPYHGTTTTCEALWMGRPVVTLAGERPASRVSASLLHALGCADWIAETPEKYVAIARRVAREMRLQENFPETLRERMRQSPLLDGAAYARNFQQTLRAAWSGEIARGVEA